MIIICSLCFSFLAFPLSLSYQVRKWCTSVQVHKCTKLYLLSLQAMELSVGYTPEKMPLNHGLNPERHWPSLINSPTVIIQSATFLFICGHLVSREESLTLRKIIASSKAMNLTPTVPLLPPVGDQSKQIVCAVQSNHLSGTQRHHSSLLADRWRG